MTSMPAIVHRAAQTDFQPTIALTIAFTAIWSCSIVETQMTKPCLLRSRVGRYDIANFDVAIRDNDAVNQQLDQLPSLRKRGRGQAVLDTVGQNSSVVFQFGIYS